MTLKRKGKHKQIFRRSLGIMKLRKYLRKSKNQKRKSRKKTNQYPKKTKRRKVKKMALF
jgi:hypothetical protein